MTLQGNLWFWSNSFGSCLGGSHPQINVSYKQSTSIYTVLKTAVTNPKVDVVQNIDTGEEGRLLRLKIASQGNIQDDKSCR